MLDIELDNIKTALRLGLIKFSFVYPIGRNHFRLLTDLSVKLTNEETIQINKGFEFDGSSAPRFLWWAFPSYGDFFFASMIHDYLYITQYKSDKLGTKEAQRFADKEMLTWSNLLNDKSIIKTLDNYLRYYAVRLFGRRLYIN